MATYTVLTSQTIKNLLQSYDLGELLDFQIMDGGQANSSVIITTGRGKYVLSVCDEKSEKDIKILTSTLDQLNHHGFRTSRLIKTREVTGHIDYQGKPVYIKEYIEGDVEKLLSAEMYYQIGQELAKLHSVPAPSDLLETFSYGIEKFIEVTASDGDYPIWLKEKTKQLQSCLNNGLPKGFVHGDLFYDNILFHNGKLTAVLDFEEACHYFLVFDLGMCIAGSCSVGETLSLDSATSLVEGYQSVRQLEKLEKELLQLHIIYGAVATSFWRFRQFNIVYPNIGKNHVYTEMMNLANHVDSISEIDFDEKFFGL
ncbi:MAG: homoserine kinase type II [Desulforhopalus sp.]|jgi:homoserine kinase type II